MNKLLIASITVFVIFTAACSGNSSTIETNDEEGDAGIAKFEDFVGEPEYMSIATDDVNGLRHYFSAVDWYKMSDSIKAQYTVLGVVITGEGESFIAPLTIEEGKYTQYEAIEKFGDRLPTAKQVKRIHQFYFEDACENLLHTDYPFSRENLRNYKERMYWTSSTYYNRGLTFNFCATANDDVSKSAHLMVYSIIPLNTDDPRVAKYANGPKSYPHDQNLVVEKDGKRYYFNKSDWKEVNDSSYTPIGILRRRDFGAVIVPLEWDNEFMTWDEAMKKTGGDLPTEEQVKIAFYDQWGHNRVADALKEFGYEAKSSHRFWSSHCDINYNGDSIPCYFAFFMSDIIPDYNTKRDLTAEIMHFIEF